MTILYELVCSFVYREDDMLDMAVYLRENSRLGMFRLMYRYM